MVTETGMYTSGEISDALRLPVRHVDFRYEILQADEAPIGDLVGVVPGGRVGYNFFADIKRSADLQVIENVPGHTYRESEIPWSEVDPVSMLLKPYYRLRMPDLGWAEIPLGV